MAGSQIRRRGLRESRIKLGHGAIDRVCVVGLGLAIAAIAPVTGGWKIVLFVAIMILVGSVMPAIWRSGRNSS